MGGWDGMGACMGMGKWKGKIKYHSTQILTLNILTSTQKMFGSIDFEQNYESTEHILTSGKQINYFAMLSELHINLQIQHASF